MTNTRIFRTFTDLYEVVVEEHGEDYIDENHFQIKLDELVDDEMIVLGSLNESDGNVIDVYEINTGIKPSDCVKELDPVKRLILLEMVQNSSTFFLYQPTQLGKSDIMSNELVDWSKDKTNKVVAFMMFANDKPLSDQSVSGIKKVFMKQNIKVEVFLLSSDTKMNKDSFIKSIVDHIHGYATDDDEDPEYGMPVICGLDNPKQREKILNLISYIVKKVSSKKSSPLRYGIIWDEADKTYPGARDVKYTIDAKYRIDDNDDDKVSFKKFVLENTVGLYRLGFASSTEGDLIMDENYEECANAYVYPVVITEEIKANYRALNHPESVSHIVPYKDKQHKHNLNTYAMEILEEYKEHFQTPIILPSGESYYRKVIVNSKPQTKDMNELAIWCNKKNYYALVINGAGGGRASIKLYKDGKIVHTYKLKYNNVAKSLNDRIYYIYKAQKLYDKPLVIIGSRKVDRGLSFHYCPREDDEVIIDGDDGEVITRNRDGIIFTDMILGSVENKDTAVQKGGRLAGVIGGSPQYPGKIHYWVDERTEAIVRRALDTVMKTNEISKDNTSLTFGQVFKRAQIACPIIRVNHNTEESHFRVYPSEDIMREAYKEIFKKEYPKSYKVNSTGFLECSLSKKVAVHELCEVIKYVPTAIKSGGGGGDGKTVQRKVFPCYKNTLDSSTLHFVIAIDPKKISPEQLAKVDSIYANIKVPHKGDF
uniref:Uncharacterized protein n=1 Tax=viral metagenome TaxID=1070528 RepID=A0A6C0LAE3_9ZZZZ